MSNVVGTKEKHMRCSRVCHWQSYHTLTSSMSYYCTDPQLNKIYLFQVIKMQNAVNDDVIYTDLMFQTCVFSFCLFSNDYHIYISVPREHNHTCNWLLEWQYEIKIYTDTTTGKAVKGNKMRHLKWKKKQYSGYQSITTWFCTPGGFYNEQHLQTSPVLFCKEKIFRL